MVKPKQPPNEPMTFEVQWVADTADEYDATG
jgi:hypothetical protein